MEEDQVSMMGWSAKGEGDCGVCLTVGLQVVGREEGEERVGCEWGRD